MALKSVHYRWALAGAICSTLFPLFGIPAVILLVKRKGEFSSHETVMQGEDKRRWEASTGNYEPHERDAYNESRLSYGSSYVDGICYEPPRTPRSAPKIIGVALACVFAIVVSIVVIHANPKLRWPLSPPYPIEALQRAQTKRTNQRTFQKM